MNTKDFKFDVKSVGEDGTFEGYLSVFDVVDLGNDLVEKGAFTKTIQEHNGTFPMLWQHDPKQPIGTLAVSEDGYGLKVQGQLVLEVRQAQEAYALLKAGVIRGLSIGYDAIKKQMDEGVRRLKEIRLFEGSVVTFPMLPDAQITAVKEAKLVEEFVELYSELKAGRALSTDRASRLRSIITEIQSLLDGAEPVKETPSEITLVDEPKGSTASEPDYHSLLSLFDKFTPRS